MRLFKCAAAALLASGVAANVSVELKAQWQSDFLLELVETLTTETTYFDLINHVAELVDEGVDYTDKQWYDDLTEFAATQAGSSAFQKSLTDAALAFRRESPLIETYYQLADSEKSECDNFFTYNDKIFCDTNDLFTLKTTKSPKNPSVYFFDHVARSVKNKGKLPVAVLYADIRSPDFPLFHKILLQEATDGKLVYVLRYKRGEHAQQTTMTGYGAELSLKKTDYMVIDDSGKEDDETDTKEDTDKSSEAPKLGAGGFTKKDIRNMGIDAAQYVLKHRNDPTAALEALKEISFNFPLHASSLNDTKPVAGFQKTMKLNVAENDFLPGSNQLFVNGALLGTGATNLQSLFDLVALEHSRLETLKKALGGAVSADDLSQIINEYPLQHALETQPERIDYRDDDAVLFLNNLDTDVQYREWPRSVAFLLQKQINIAHNAHSVVIPFNMDDFVDVKLDPATGEPLNISPINRGKLTVLFTMLQRHMPIQFGVVPYGTTTRGRKMAEYLHYLARENDPTAALRFLFAIGAGTEVEDIFTQIPPGPNGSLTKSQVDSALESGDYAHYVDAGKNWMQRLGLDISQAQEPSFIMNGIVQPFSEKWQSLVGARFQQDMPIMQKVVQDAIIKLSKEEPEDIEDEDEEDEDAGNPVDKFFAKNSIRDLLVEGKSTKRNLLLSPASFHNLEYVTPAELEKINYKSPSALTVAGSKPEIFTNAIFAGNYGSPQFVTQLISILEAQQTLSSSSKFAFRTLFVHTGGESGKGQRVNSVIQSLAELDSKVRIALLKDTVAFLEGKKTEEDLDKHVKTKKLAFNKKEVAAGEFLKQYKSTESSSVFVIDGLISDIATRDLMLNKSEVIALYEREAIRRLELVSVAFSDLKLLEKTVEENLDLAKLHSHLAHFFYGIEDQESTLSEIRAFHTARWEKEPVSFVLGDEKKSLVKIVATIDALSDKGQQMVALVEAISQLPDISVRVYLNPKTPDAREEPALPLKRFYRSHNVVTPQFDAKGAHLTPNLDFAGLPASDLLTFGLDTPSSWIAMPADNDHDLDNIVLDGDAETRDFVDASYSLQNILIEGSIIDITKSGYASGVDLLLKSTLTGASADTLVMSNLGYFQLQAGPGLWELNLGPSASDIYYAEHEVVIPVTDVLGPHISLSMERKKGKEDAVIGSSDKSNLWNKLKKNTGVAAKKQADINIFTVASGHLYERFLSIMTASVMAHTGHTVKFWLIENFLSASFKAFLPHLAEHYGFEYELVTYQWPHWLRGQTEKQRQIWGYKILFLDVLFPQDLDRVIFIDSDQIVRTDLYELVEMDLDGAPYGFTPMCNSRKEMDGFRFWKQGYWETFLGDDLVYHISALFVVDLKVFRAQRIGDRLRVHYHQLSADPASLSNLDQDLPNNLQRQVPIFSLPQDWLWCETWCSDASLKTAKTIDMCNNPLTKEPKLDRARRQVPEWTEYDDEIKKLRKDAEQENEKNDSGSKKTVVVDVEEDGEEDHVADLHDEL